MPKKNPPKNKQIKPPHPLKTPTIFVYSRYYLTVCTMQLSYFYYIMRLWNDLFGLNLNKRINVSTEHIFFYKPLENPLYGQLVFQYLCTLLTQRLFVLFFLSGGGGLYVNFCLLNIWFGIFDERWRPFSCNQRTGIWNDVSPHSQRR